MELNVLLFKRPDMLAVQQNLYNLVGFNELENLFRIEGYKTTQKSIIWYYPERFLNILEQRVLVSRAEAAGYESLDIVTNSVYIVQTVEAKHIRIVQDENIPEGDGRFKLSNPYSGLPNDGGLGVIGGSIL